MRLASPTSRTRIRFSLAPIDVLWVAVAPFLALALRDPALLDPGEFPTKIPETYQYAFVAIGCAVVFLLLFRLGDNISRFFSVRDAFVVCVAVACTVASSSALAFSLTRLDGVPRSTPLILALVLGSGLTVIRAVARVLYKEMWVERQQAKAEPAQLHLRRIILLGVDRFAAVAIKLTDYQMPRTTQVVAALDARSEMVGRKISGVNVVGVVGDLDAVIEEYIVHGVEIDEVWVSDEAALPADVAKHLRLRCEKRGIGFLSLSEAFHLTPSAASQTAVSSASHTEMEQNAYFALKRATDICAASVLFVALAPLAVIAGCLVLYDVGAPMLFWQQRIGMGGRKFSLYKFRTYHAPFDKDGQRIPDDKRLSRLGRAIRATRLDEIPQLYNVLVGDMSLIGPRPLLPHDQPRDPRMRLLVRPGITGWAQVNGGTSVTPEEKDALDVWYIRHASLWLDLKIAFFTVWIALSGEKLNPAAVAHAIRWRSQHFGNSESQSEEMSFDPNLEMARRAN